MIEFWWSIWAAWAWWRYQSRRKKMPVLSREMSRGLLKSMVDSGITEANKLEAMGVRRVDILEWKEETNRKGYERLDRDFEFRQQHLIKQ